MNIEPCSCGWNKWQTRNKKERHYECRGCGVVRGHQEKIQQPKTEKEEKK